MLELPVRFRSENCERVLKNSYNGSKSLRPAQQLSWDLGREANRKRILEISNQNGFNGCSYKAE